MSMIRWLHISDLHYGYESYVTTEMRSNMLKSLPAILTDVGQVDYLFITGDLRYGKNCKDSFPDEIISNIRELMSACNIPSERVYIVMGNHDVVHELGRKDIAPLLRKDYYDRNGYLDRDRMKILEQSQQKFYDVYQAICDRDPFPYHAVIAEEDFNIICLNTSFSCSNDGDDGNLIVGMDLLQNTLKDIDPSKPGIVLAHHGFESLQKRERDFLEIKLKENGVLLYLCGHEHLANCRNIADRRENQSLFEYTCGTGMDKLPNGQPAEMVVFMGELDTVQKRGCIRAWEWRERSGAWSPYSDISHKQTGLSDGHHYFPKSPQNQQITESLKKEAMEQYYKYLLYECGEIRLDGMPADDKVGSKILALEKLFIPNKYEEENYCGISRYSFSSKLFEAAKANNMTLSQYIYKQLDDIENMLWSQYSDDFLFEIERFLRGDTSRNKPLLSKDERDYLIAKLEATKNELPDKNVLVPTKHIGFRRVVLAGPGGGKTTLLKRIALAYTFPGRREDSEINDNLPDRELLPVWIRCRDLRESASLSLSQVIQTIPTKAEFRPDRDDHIKAFLREVFERIEKGTAVILIDGLDEIVDTSLRKRFAENIARFIQLHPNTNIIVTSRISGFEYVSNGKFGNFPRVQISKLDESDIRLLCHKWHKVIYSEREEVFRQAEALFDMILKHNKIYTLAESPLLLMTLLLVHRRVGRLPTKRAALYEESIKVLLETWNLEAHEPIEPETAKCQLAFVAFEMMRNGIQTIGKRHLESLLRKVRKEQSWLPSGIESPAAFLERVELRSSILIKRGFQTNDTGYVEEEYEFQHLTFQEYLAAFAVVYGYYEDADRKDYYIDSLNDFYDDANKEEVVLLTATQAQRKEVSRLVEAIIGKLDYHIKLEKANKILQLRNLLVKIVLDDVQLIEASKHKIFSAIISDDITRNQLHFIRDVLNSNHRKEFIDFLDKKGYKGLASAIDILDNEPDPLGKWFELMNLDTDSSSKQIVTVNTLDYTLRFADASNIRNYLADNCCVIDMLIDIIMKYIDVEAAIKSAECLYSILLLKEDRQTLIIPNGFTLNLSRLIYEKNELGKMVRLFEILPFTNAKTLFFLGCPQKIKQFLLNSYINVKKEEVYKQGAYWATLFAGVWNWGVAEKELEIFRRINKDTYIIMRKQLEFFKAEANN